MKIQLPRYLTAGLCALAFAFVASTSFAKEDGDKAPKGPSKSDVKKYDKNGDGMLDDAESAEMKAAKDAEKEAKKAARLEKYDTNKDGKISKDEKVAEDADKDAAKAAKAEKKAMDDAKKAERAKEKSKKQN